MHQKIKIAFEFLNYAVLKLQVFALQHNLQKKFFENIEEDKLINKLAMNDDRLFALIMGLE